MNVGKLIKKFKGVFSDLTYTIMASVVINVVLQLIIYPIITKKFGSDVTGEILYFIGIIYIIPQAIGTSINNSRLLMRKNGGASNGDYEGILTLTCVLGALVSGAIAFGDTFNGRFALAYGIFSAIYALRMYAQVEFRLNLKFSKYFLYYAIVSVGYLIGFGIYLITGQWIIIFFVGEIMALTYSIFKGEIFKKEKPIAVKGKVYKTVSLIMFSTFVRDGVNQFDKVILKQILGPGMVTEYNAVSVIAKTVQMLVGPVNTLILSYLTVKNTKLSRQAFKKYVIVSLGIGCLVLLTCLVGTPIYLKLFYSELYERVIGYSFIINLGLIAGFIASLYMAILLSQGKTVLHTTIQCVWGVTYVVSAYILTNKYSLMGMATATMLCNVVKIIAVVILVFRCLEEEQAIRLEK